MKKQLGGDPEEENQERDEQSENRFAGRRN